MRLCSIGRQGLSGSVHQIRTNEIGLTQGIRCLTKTVANRKGWRLPTVQELASLHDGTLLPAGHPFLNVQNDIYWSASTTAANGPALAWFVSFADGHIANIFKTVTYNFWCVRGGQAVDPQ
jgi:Protein of unknown function (DUF1566)